MKHIIVVIMFMVQGYGIPCFIAYTSNAIPIFWLAMTYFLIAICCYVALQFWLLTRYF